MPKTQIRLCRQLDILAHQALHMGLLDARPDCGEIWHLNGRRAERLDKRTGYGRVTVHTTRIGRRYQAMAHRVIWIAAYGIPTWDTVICHTNGHGWDNRIDNLTARIEAGDVRIGQVLPYTPPAHPRPPAATPPQARP